MIRIKLKELLKKKNMTMVELSDLTGVTQNTLGLFANGKSNGIQFVTLDRILSALQVDIGEIIHHYASTFNISVQLEETIEDYNKKKYFRYKIIAKSNEDHEIYESTMTFSCTESTLDYRKTIFISPKLSPTPEELIVFGHDGLDFIFFNQHDKDALTVIMYLVSTNLIKSLPVNGLESNSLVLFSWRGFIPIDTTEKINALNLHDSDNGILLPDIPSLKNLEIVDNITHNLKLDEYTVDIYIK